MGLIYGFLSCWSWGIADYLSRKSSVQLGSFRVAFYVNFLGAIFLGIIFLTQGAFLGWETEIEWTTLSFLGLGLGALMGIGFACFFRGLVMGMVSVVSSITAAWLPVSVIVAILFLNESLSSSQAVLVAVITGGILLLGFNRSLSEVTATGFWYAIVTMFCMGLVGAYSKTLTLAGGPVLAAASIHLGAAIFLCLAAIIQKTSIAWPNSSDRPLVLIVALLNALGFLSYTLGFHGDVPVSLMAPIAAAHPLVTIIFAWFLLRERPSSSQGVGILVILGGVITFSAVSGT